MDIKNIEGILDEMMDINGAMAAAVIDWESGMALGTRSNGSFDIEMAAAGNADVIKAKMATLKRMGLDTKIVDILITLEDQFHVVMMSKNHPELCLYVAVDSEKGNLALARNILKSLA